MYQGLELLILHLDGSSSISAYCDVGTEAASGLVCASGVWECNSMPAKTRTWV